MKKLFSILFLAFSTMVIAQESTLLRLNYEKGDKYLTKMNMKQDMGVAKTNMDMHMITTVKDVVDDVYKLEVNFDKVMMNVFQNGTSMNYDSSVKEEEMSAQAKAMHSSMKPMLEMVIGMDVTKLGKTSNMKFIKGEGNVEQAMQNTNAIEYPKEKVKVGTKWTQTSANSGMKIITNYVVKAITPTVVTLSLDGTVSELAKGTLSGDVQIDKKLGIPTRTNMTMELEMMGQKIKTDMLVIMNKM